MKKVVLINMLAVSLLSTESFASSYDEYAIKPAEQQLSNQQQKVDEPISFLPIPTFITEPAVGPGLGVVGLFFHDNEKKAKKKKKDNGVWMLVLSAFVIALFALLRSKGYFS